MAASRVAFIGMGRMGLPMAKNLVQKGFDVACFDSTAARREIAAGEGLKVASSAPAAAAGASTVVTALPAGKEVQEVLAGILFDAVDSETLFVDCSTISPGTSRELEAAARDKGLAMVDAPMSGGVPGARAGTLTFMVGAGDGDFERAAVVLGAMGRPKKVGGPGSGSAAKLCNNLMMAIQMVAVSEGFTLAKALGLDHRDLFAVASTSTSQCWSMTSYAPVPDVVPTSPANRNFEAGFSGSLMHKDLRLALDAAAANDATLPVGTRVADLYADMINADGGDADFSAIITHLHRLSRS
mmetsp:Transcript_10704/g.27244  ORF Transcript_10704/g.27244 Transcript_10704/m.27244 type:complete len:298 (-) Transcript_10704:24-917(-)|eukprot:CAMPEP_0197421578 /NCGR_PEP_ID=MMETSP1170-20131217/9429_1 /TAXON_ID=54406 /ORGANISM="Sarcinochrysis sp, Strain CCMP770" /LENGTH=297 /DNA_ID=CAMNT_0042948829 /DNA_START=32 /DNA_END=925 /DNA_ORIENTATION=+